MNFFKRKYEKFEKSYSKKYGRKEYLKKAVWYYKITLVLIPIIIIFLVFFLILGLLYLRSGGNSFAQVFSYISYFLASGLCLFGVILAIIRLPIYKRKSDEAKKEMEQTGTELK